MDVWDVRFPTSEQLDGSDAMNPDPDYSAAYVMLRTNATDGLEGHALAFTTGPGNEVQASAIQALRSRVLGLDVDEACADLGAFSRRLVYDPHLRWLGPEKGVMHMAIGAVVNAAWDLAGKRAGKPVWQLLAEMSPEDLVATVDFRYLSDALTPQESLEILRRAEPGRAERAEALQSSGYPPTPRALDGCATQTRCCSNSQQRRSQTVSLRSSSRSAPTSRKTYAGWDLPAKLWAATSGSRSTPTSGGTSARRWSG
jgi:L-fuconate dehydratase